MNPVVFLTAFATCLAFMPAIIRISISKNVLDHPAPRKIHLHPVPLLGGAGIFAAIVLTLTFFGARYIQSEGLFLFTSLFILFFTGLRDDVQTIGPGVKLSGQVIAAAITVLFGGIRLSDFHGLFGITLLPFWVSVVFSILLVVFIINSINFIDGVDGLAGALIAMAGAVAGLIFTQAGDGFFAAFAWSVAGGTAGFLYFNRPPARIFLGDTGSMTLGFSCAVLALRLAMGVHLPSVMLSPASGMIFAYSLLLLPAVDGLRMIFQRLAESRSPFRPDNEHIHHQLLRKGWSVLKVTCTLTLLQAGFMIAGWYWRNMDPSYVFPILLVAMYFSLWLLRAYAGFFRPVPGK